MISGNAYFCVLSRTSVYFSYRTCRLVAGKRQRLIRRRGNRSYRRFICRRPSDQADGTGSRNLTKIAAAVRDGTMPAEAASRPSGPMVLI